MATVWPATIVQTCVIHLMRASFRYATRQDWDAISRALKPVYQAATVAEAEERFGASGRIGWSMPAAGTVR